MVVYLNKKTLEHISIIDFDSSFYADEEVWQEYLEEIEKNRSSYLLIEKMDSRESYEVMEEFVETVDDKELKMKLELGLNLSKPFRNFKDIIEYAGEYRNKWFKFKEDKYIEYVKEQVELYNNGFS